MEAIYMKLVEMSISASWLVLAVLLLRFLLKKSPRWIHVALWALVAVRLACPMTVESSFSLNPVNLTQRIVEDIPDSYVGPSSAYWDYLPEYREAVDAGAEPIYAGEGHYYVVTGETPQTPVLTTRYIGSWVWLCGMAAMLAWAGISYYRLKCKVDASIDLGNGVFICDYIDTPFILGIVKPKIYLPSSMEPDAASHVLAHERSHIKRKDHWWKPLGYLLLSVHWFNPLLWLAYILLCRDIELACDEKVIRDMEIPQKKAYSEALLNCSVNRRHIAACPLAFGEVGVKRRIKTVLNYRKPAFWIVFVAVIALIVTAVCFLTDPVKEDKALVQDGALQDPHELAWLYWTQYMEQEYSTTLCFISFGGNRSVQVSYDGKEYTISDEVGQREYRYCVKSQATSEIDMVEEYFFLTNDPYMTADRYLTEEDILATEVLYVDRKTFDTAESYGDVPESMEEILYTEQSSWGQWCCPKSMFRLSYRILMNSVREAYEVIRYNYSGNILCEFKIKGIPQSILELEDGGFVVFGTSEPDGLYAFNCYDESGDLRWKYNPEEGGRKYVPYMYQQNGDIYCFGTVTPTSQSSDIYIWRISQDGNLVQKIKIGGSDFDDIHRVLETERGFEILGSTQSGDGDLPFSKDGYGAGFRLEISKDLELISKEKFESHYYSQVGYLHGKPVFADDEILKTSRNDRLPKVEHTSISGIFDWEDGYVIVRTLNYNAYRYNNPVVSMQTYYDQLVITGYDSDGNPLWQLAGNVRTG